MISYKKVDILATRCLMYYMNYINETGGGVYFSALNDGSLITEEYSNEELKFEEYLHPLDVSAKSSVTRYDVGTNTYASNITVNDDQMSPNKSGFNRPLRKLKFSNESPDK